ncbi:MAG: hypothetical protein Q4A94_01030 [Plesiomonas sp.]|nr:hypothetical protein [Plesiomonas sp.]
MKSIIFILCFFCGAALSGEIENFCEKKDSVGQVEAGRINSAESGYTVSSKGRSYFYSAPDDKCKTRKFIVFRERIDAYMEYNGFYYVVYFGKNGVTTQGWMKSERIKENGYGVGHD